MRARSRAVLLAALTGLLVVAPVTSAQAHPLGNFSVNHYNGLVLHAGGVDLLAVVDSAELPTQQELPSIDTDGDGTASTAELANHAQTQCADLVEAVDLGVDGSRLPWSIEETALETRPGAAGLPTLRLTCTLAASADLTAASAVTLVDTYRSDRVGWHEITAQGDGVRLVDPPVPAVSISDELRTYPEDLLSSPLADSSVTLQIEPGDGASGQGSATVGGEQDPFTRLVNAGDRQLQDIIEGELTPTLGLLSVLLAVLLGAGHAMLPGHGKTVMAAYLAGRRGSRRDAVSVGALVTVTHTASVLVLGLAISVSAALVGEQVLRYLGVFSGLLIALVGGLLLREALRSRRRERLPTPAAALAYAGAQVHGHGSGRAHDHGHDHNRGHDHGHDRDRDRDHNRGHDHGHGHGHDHDHDRGHDPAHAHAEHGDHDHGHDQSHHVDDHDDQHDHAQAHQHGYMEIDGAVHGHDTGHDHDHVHVHDQVHNHAEDLVHSHGGSHVHSHGGSHVHSHAGGLGGWLTHSHSHLDGGDGDDHGHRHGPHEHPGRGGTEPRANRGGLFGMGIAGGLVPSPSALVVLLGSIALGRTVFGVLLVLCYGLGMAATLTAVGLVLVRVRGRIDRFDAAGRLSLGASRLVAAVPVITAVLVLVVGLGLAVRGLTSAV